MESQQKLGESGPYLSLFASISSLLCLIELLLLVQNHHLSTSLRSALYIDTYLFLRTDWRQTSDWCCIAEGSFCYLFSLFLHAVHINPHRRWYAAQIMFHSASLFWGKHPSHSGVFNTKLPERDITFQTHRSRLLSPEKIHTPPIQNWIGPNHLVSLQESNCKVPIKATPTDTWK